MYMKASPEPTKKNCGISKKTLMGRVAVLSPTAFATDNRLLSASAAAVIPTIERMRPKAILCRLEKPVAE